MSFNAQILADSLSPQGDRITTMKITFPRMVLAEFNTHRMFSRNSASSRAIPFAKMVQSVKDNPFVPIAWQKDHKGMQGTEYFTRVGEILYAEHKWRIALSFIIGVLKMLNKFKVTKQLCNRLLEPFMWHTVIVTATEWENFFKLRCPRYETKFGTFYSKKDARNAEIDITDRNPNIEILESPDLNDTLGWLQINSSQAEIHIQAIAELMWDAMNESTPKQLQPGEWHIPFGDNIDIDWCNDKMQFRNGTIEDLMVEIATARCARISYETLGDDPKIDYEADIRLHDMLLESGHMSPFEHCARAMSDEEFEYYKSFSNAKFNEDGTLIEDSVKGWCRNFRGFIQYRHLVEL